MLFIMIMIVIYFVVVFRFLKFDLVDWVVSKVGVCEVILDVFINIYCWFISFLCFNVVFLVKWKFVVMNFIVMVIFIFCYVLLVVFYVLEIVGNFKWKSFEIFYDFVCFLVLVKFCVNLVVYSFFDSNFWD